MELNNCCNVVVCVVDDADDGEDMVTWIIVG